MLLWDDRTEGRQDVKQAINGEGNILDGSHLESARRMQSDIESVSELLGSCFRSADERQFEDAILQGNSRFRSMDGEEQFYRR